MAAPLPLSFRLPTAAELEAGRPELAKDGERLIDLVQGQGVAVVDRAIDTHVFGLRKKLGACADIVETIRGVGYRVRTLD
jgi:DNA-binding response OmpR family regulator